MSGIDIPAGLVDALHQARHIAALTGAGVSAESGVPTFREAQTGLWARYHPEDLATPGAFRRNPSLVWQWYAWRQELVARVEPNPGHYALARMQRLAPEFTLITQNVDSLHQRAGSQAVLELHGNLARIKCSRENIVVENWTSSMTGADDSSPPRCPNCGSPLRPDVVWFGEALPQTELESAIAAARKCDLFFSIGTSGLVQPAASLPWMALEAGAVVAEINLQPTELTRLATFVLTGASGRFLPELVRQAWGEA